MLSGLITDDHHWQETRRVELREREKFALYIALHALLVATDIDNFEKVENRKRSCNNDDTKHAAVAHQFSNFISHFLGVVIC
jgi:hypothetical protein